jgi:hypothetical protein
MGLLTLKEPEIEPVTVAQLIGYGHLDPNEDQAFLGMLITSARQWCEAFCERAFMFQTKRLLMDFFPGYVDFKMAGQRVSSPFVSGSNAVLVGIRYAIVLPWPMVRELLTLQFQDANGAPVVMQPGVDFIADVDSQPARLTPPFGLMWPVARVIVNAVQVDYVTGYAGPITVGMTAGSAVIDSTFNFLPRDVGAAITIPKAGASGADLATKITAVDASGQATALDMAAATVSGQKTNFGILPVGIQLAILALASWWYEKRLPDTSDIPAGVTALLYPYRDLRM